MKTLWHKPSEGVACCRWSIFLTMRVRNAFSSAFSHQNLTYFPEIYLCVKLRQTRNELCSSPPPKWIKYCFQLVTHPIPNPICQGLTKMALFAAGFMLMRREGGSSSVYLFSSVNLGKTDYIWDYKMNYDGI